MYTNLYGKDERDFVVLFVVEGQASATQSGNAIVLGLTHNEDRLIVSNPFVDC